SGREQRRFTGDGKLGPAVLSPDGTLVIAEDSTGEIRLFDAATGRRVRSQVLPEEVKADRSQMNILWPSPDGKVLAVGTRRGIFRYEIASGRESPPLRSGGDSHMTALAFAPDGRRLITTGAYGVIRRWDAATGAEVPGGEV